MQAQEICANAIDDDGDGLIDLNDAECACTGFGGSANVSSLIPNSSFENRTCCPSGYSMLNCAVTWIQASTPTSDYWNTCGTAGSAFDGLAPLPLPDGTGFVGFINMTGWQEYVGACLSQPMTAGSTYNLTFQFGHTNSSPPIDFTFYGSPNCGDIPFSGNDCPMGQGGFVTLGSQMMGGGTGWVEQTITFTPTVDINALVMGGACGSGGARTYYYLDDLSLVSTEEFDVLSISQTGQYCDNDIQLHAVSDSAGGTWQWYKEGVALLGQTTPNLNVALGLPGIGNYTVVYTMGNQCESIDIEVLMPDLPTANFSTANVCYPDEVAFQDLSTVASGTITDWNWTFGDNTQSTQQDPNHAYAANGTYLATLTITTDINCTASFQTNVTVYPKPDAQFNSVAGCLGDPSVFTDQSAINAPGIINSWEWDFGDLNTSTLQNPSNFYVAESTYNVELIVTSTNGCKDTLMSNIDVYPSPLLDVSVIAECTLDDVQFVNNSSISSGTIAQFDWDFGDSGSSALASPTHVYLLPNTYAVQLQATSDQGCQSDTSFQLISYPNPVADLSVSDECFGDPITVLDNSSVVAPGVIGQYELDLGDGSAILNAVPSQYQYALSGVYNIELIVTTQHGCDDTTQLTSSIYDLPVADFSFTNICEDDSLQFTDLSTIPSGAINSWQWSFGNGNSSLLQTAPYQSYPADNTYPVSLIVSSGFGCADTLTDVIEVYPVPIAGFVFDSACFPLPIQFTDVSQANGTYPITSWQWTFSSGQVSALQSPSVNFAAPGTYSATLLISNGPGCKSTFADGDAVVHPLPVAQFPSGMATCLNDTIFLTDQSTLAAITDDLINSWRWTLNDGNVLNAQHGFHVYAASGLYDVQLAVQTNHGCTDVVSNVVEIYPLPLVDFSSSPFEGCAPLFVQFQDGSSIPAPYQLASWQWHLQNDSSVTNGQNPALTYDPAIDPLSVASYDISLQVTSTNGCVSEIVRPDYLTIYPKPDALFSVDEDVRNIIKPRFEFTDLSSVNVVAWNWEFGDGNTSNDQHPVHWYDAIGVYPIELIVETQYGCLDTIGYRVKVDPVFTFYVPNSFTPDEDGINDLFFGQGEGYTTYSMYVYDRWGELIFQSNDDQFPWDGSYKGKQVQTGTYIYTFYLIDWQGHDHQYDGRVTLHR